MSGHEDSSYLGTASQPDGGLATRTAFADPDTVGTRLMSDPTVLQTPSHLIVPLSAAATTSEGVGVQQAPVTPAVQEPVGIPEVMKLTIPVPKLNISADEKAKNSGHSVADWTRAYVRDARQYLQAVHGRGCDSIKCLFVGNTLEGVAKDWYDEWTTARGKYTFDNLIDALLARFATEVRSGGNKARKTQAQGTYHMRPHETVPAYQSRFEALITPIVNFPEED
ncbi:hypothetical protein VaNZ11_010305, partial [Volvox africanus]